MTVEISTTLPASPDRIWEMVNRPVLLHYVAWPLLTFEPIDPSTFPDRWEEREYRVQMKAFGMVPLGWQVIGIERSVGRDATADGGTVRRLRDNGRGRILRRWDHVITIEPAGSTEESRDSGQGPVQKTRYTDHVEIEAGVLTPVVGVLARGFYTHRQRRWHRLLEEEDRGGGITDARLDKL
jgi:hypothetical protein